jgi:hypothetical protein
MKGSIPKGCAGYGAPVVATRVGLSLEKKPGQAHRARPGPVSEPDEAQLKR